MASKRTIITLPDDDKAWLEGYSRTKNISMAEAIRQGIRKLKESMQQDNYQLVLKKTKGKWTAEDGLEYQNNVRSEWDSR
jgi:Arc/MetJ-type ribon-helix-helix transcriptional regulator